VLDTGRDVMRCMEFGREENKIDKDYKRRMSYGDY
jgi:hypothetical protein